MGLQGTCSFVSHLLMVWSCCQDTEARVHEVLAGMQQGLQMQKSAKAMLDCVRDIGWFCAVHIYVFRSCITYGAHRHS
jgi:hypothetical protein